MVNTIELLIEKTLIPLGYELVDCEFSNHQKLLRVFIDKSEGVTVDDCAFVSNQLGRVLTVDGSTSYQRLEVSSPGLDRVLKKIPDFEKFIGKTITIETHKPIIDNRRRIVGKLMGVFDDTLQLFTENEQFLIVLSNIKKARLLPTF